MNPISRSTSGKREHFGQMDILLIVLGKAQVMTQFKSTSRTKVKRSHSCAQLKTDHFSGSKKIKSILKKLCYNNENYFLENFKQS